MRGMMTLRGVRALNFSAYVLEIDHSPLERDRRSAQRSKTAGTKLILTNGSVDRVDAVLARLGIATHFDGVFDIIAAEFEPKPARQTYEKFLGLHDVDPTRAAMFEDLALQPLPST